MQVHIRPVREVAVDFPKLHKKFFRGVPLSNGYYIKVVDEEVFVDDLMGDKIDLVFGERHAFRKLSRQHGACWDRGGDCYFINKWDAEQVKAMLEKVIAENFR